MSFNGCVVWWCNIYLFHHIPLVRLSNLASPNSISSIRYPTSFPSPNRPPNHGAAKTITTKVYIVTHRAHHCRSALHKCPPPCRFPRPTKSWSRPCTDSRSNWPETGSPTDSCSDKRPSRSDTSLTRTHRSPTPSCWQERWRTLRLICLSSDTRIRLCLLRFPEEQSTSETCLREWRRVSTRSCATDVLRSSTEGEQDDAKSRSPARELSIEPEIVQIRWIFFEMWSFEKRRF